jgi:SAM-dependent methyltransferase
MILQKETLAGCPICAGTRLRHLLTAPDYESRTGDYGIEECLQCGVAFTNPRPIASELPKLYDERATADFPRAGGLVRRLREFAIDRYIAGQLRTTKGTDNDPFRALDYGCGDGALANGLVRFARAHGREPKVTAVDFHDSAPAALSSGDAAIAYQQNAAWHAQPGQYDAIFLRHVLEHHPEPRQLLGELIATLRPGGRLFIEVPNRRSVWAAVFGRRYFGYYLPRHLMHFDVASLELLMCQAGCESVHVTRAHTPLIGRSLGYLSGRDIGNTGFIGLASYPLQVILDAACGRSSTLRATGSRD